MLSGYKEDNINKRTIHLYISRSDENAGALAKILGMDFALGFALGRNWCNSGVYGS